MEGKSLLAIAPQAVARHLSVNWMRRKPTALRWPTSPKGPRIVQYGFVPKPQIDSGRDGFDRSQKPNIAVPMQQAAGPFPDEIIHFSIVRIGAIRDNFECGGCELGLRRFAVRRNRLFGRFHRPFGYPSP
ncbi:MAG TPA: hypothetical protein VGG30_09655 [Pirellulales bacterium]|jgi:hypothetical protein